MAEKGTADRILEWSFRIVAMLTAAVIVVILLSSAIAIAGGSLNAAPAEHSGVSTSGDIHFIKAVDYDNSGGCTLLPPINISVVNAHQ